MKRLILCLSLACCLLLLVSGTAGAAKPTLKSLAKSVAALQRKANSQAATIASLSDNLASANDTRQLHDHRGYG